MKTELKDILLELRSSRDNGNVIGIRLKESHKMLLTVVENFLDDQKVVVKSSTLYGQSLSTTTIQLVEIESVIHFNTLYEDPLFVRLREIKRSIREMQNVKRSNLKV